MERLRRPASVSLEAFLLPSDDPRVARARLSKSTGKLTKGGDKRAPPPWALCETRHHRSRDEEDLGPQRVLTRWKDGGGAPDPIEGLWKTWLGVQVERVCDSLDINSLRLAKEMVDARELILGARAGGVLTTLPSQSIRASCGTCPRTSTAAAEARCTESRRSVLCPAPRPLSQTSCSRSALHLSASRPT